MKCSTDEEGVEPAVVAQKIYFWTVGKNLTESELINTVGGPKNVIFGRFQTRTSSPVACKLCIKTSMDPCFKQFLKQA